MNHATNMNIERSLAEREPHGAESKPEAQGEPNAASDAAGQSANAEASSNGISPHVKISRNLELSGDAADGGPDLRRRATAASRSAASRSTQPANSEASSNGNPADVEISKNLGLSGDAADSGPDLRRRAAATSRSIRPANSEASSNGNPADVEISRNLELSGDAADVGPDLRRRAAVASRSTAARLRSGVMAARDRSFDQPAPPREVVDQAAAAARTTGHRFDLMRFMRLRRGGAR